jgi:hypothetical protein
MSISGALASILLVVGVTACAGRSDTTSPLIVSGTLSIQVLGLDSTVIQGAGAVSVVRTDAGHQSVQTHSVPANGVVELSVPVGTYSVSYFPVGGYNVVTVLQVTVAVTNNMTTALTFGLKLSPGTIDVVADIVNARPDNGGSYSVLRTDVANGFATAVSIPYDFVGDEYYAGVDVPPGTYRVSYKPPDGFVVATGSGYTVTEGTGITTLVIRPNVVQVTTFEVAGKSP